MTDVHIDAVDLSLLPALEILLDERHVTRAAARAHVTQSAMSRTLARVRVACDDELLVRSGGGYELTPRARAIQDELGTIMPSLRALFTGARFDPAAATDLLRIAASD
ncbi:MAG TPA: LysR family transcriptional regulator, partial [Microbacterium sp.]|nr:LysR family transcriptional regulator [Microbacterium sp.]